MTRRRFGVAAGMTVASCCASVACRAPHTTEAAAALGARPAATSTTRLPGTHVLGGDRTVGGVLSVPPAAADGPVPLIVLLHGAGGSGSQFLEWLRPAANDARVALLAPDAVGRTWDALQAGQRTLLDLLTGERRAGGFGPDVAALERALAVVFETVAVDPTRIAVAGFSDGASYALSLGLANGHLFRRIVAFSPGFVIDGARRGRPDVFVSHGRADDILPIDRCSRRIVPALQKGGYAVTFREFDGGHDVPASIAGEGLRWAVSPAAR